ncbi:MAG: hypothetical protein PHT59_07530, partial [Candidatus Omnitrophica bacterium]|nr:hypothetical protein [Candidatus Omnitrophota bacterium]
GNAERDLLPVTQDRMTEIAYWLVETNPLAGWLVDVTTAFILSEGIPFESKNEDVQKVLNGFWNDPVNRMQLYFPKHVNELQIFGELCFPAFTAGQTGRVRCGYVDPAYIDQVITDPENVRMVIGVLTKSWTGNIGGMAYYSDPKKYRTILPEGADQVLSPTAQQIREQLTDGDCFFWSINNVTNSPRGRSSLLSIADWLDVYEQFLFDYGDKWGQFNSFVWDLLVTGGKAEDINEQLKNFSKKSGSAFGHNEKVTLQAVTPDLKTNDALEGARLFRNHILGRWGFPEHWYGGGGDVNRATASEMDTPTLKIMSLKQLTVKYIMEDMLGYQVRQARNARYLRVSDEEAVFSTTLPEMGTKDISKMSTAAQQMATAVVTAEIQDWVDKDTARKLFASIVSFTGVEMNFDEIKKTLEEQGSTKGYEDYLKREKGKKPPLEVVGDNNAG